MTTALNVIKLSQRINLLFLISTLIAIVTFTSLGIHEVNAGSEMNLLMKTNFKKVDRQLEKYITVTPAHLTIHTEMRHGLNQYVRNTHLMLASILTVVALLSLIGMYVLTYFRRLKQVDNEQLLDELLYYDKLNYQHDNNDAISNIMKSLHSTRETFIDELQTGLDNNQFVLYYQPIVNTQTEIMTDVEALLRWQHPIYGLLSPAIFLPYCENSGLIIPIGEWVFKTAFKQLCDWHKMGYSAISISINLSSKQLNDSNLLTLIKNTLEENAALAPFLKVEISEETIMRDIEKTIPILKSLRELGIQLSLDDFGMGYAPLHYIKQLPISNIKIDKSFINDITHNITSLGIVESVMNLGKNLGLTITVEGVEEAKQVHLIKKMKCDYIQGYFYGKPLPVNELTQRLNKTHDVSIKHAIRYEVLSSQYSEEAVHLITNTFCHHEPMTNYLNITPNEFTPFAELMVEKAIHDSLSIVAIDDGKVIACTIVEDIANPLNIAINLDPRFTIIFSLLESLAGDFFKERIPAKGHVSHLFITAVDDNHLNKGLSKEINLESMKRSKEKGFDFMCCEFTHEYNERGTVKNIKNNKLLICSRVYKDFMLDDKKPFKDLEGSASAYIWELHEGAKLNYHAS